MSQTFSPGVIETDFFAKPGVKDYLASQIALKPDAIARAIGYAITQPADVNEIIIRPTAGAQ